MTTNIQSEILTQLNSSMAIRGEEVKDGAMAIETPFLDWKGYPVTIYVTVGGRVTDGGNTLNELRSLRVIQEYENWVFRDDFFQRYNIVEWKNKELEPADIKDLLSYVQGIARLTYYFKPNPIKSPKNHPTTKEVAQNVSIYDKLNNNEVASFLEIFKNKQGNKLSERDEAIIIQAVNRLRKNKGGE